MVPAFLYVLFFWELIVMEMKHMLGVKAPTSGLSLVALLTHHPDFLLQFPCLL